MSTKPQNKPLGSLEFSILPTQKLQVSEFENSYMRPSDKKSFLLKGVRIRYFLKRVSRNFSLTCEMQITCVDSRQDGSKRKTNFLRLLLRCNVVFCEILLFFKFFLLAYLHDCILALFRISYMCFVSRLGFLSCSEDSYL